MHALGRRKGARRPVTRVRDAGSLMERDGECKSRPHFLSRSSRPLPLALCRQMRRIRQAGSPLPAIPLLCLPSLSSPALPDESTRCPLPSPRHSPRKRRSIHHKAAGSSATCSPSASFAASGGESSRHEGRSRVLVIAPLPPDPLGMASPAPDALFPFRWIRRSWPADDEKKERWRPAIHAAQPQLTVGQMHQEGVTLPFLRRSPA